eukprot:TRINITY_DN67097_c0_g1_i1.p1 TRINITY_DN67097_c0_g1~~TRINITY_DN67097_c0_g1_i1.p1  ORF type:complete len:186 (+),score=24.24 TRINITY_DN67097_c0_g1_i1:32-559(+)
MADAVMMPAARWRNPIRFLREAVFTRTGLIASFGIACGWYLISDLIADYLAAKRAKKYQELVAKMHLESREWRVGELQAYDGGDAEKPILIGVNGDVFNVWRGRDFYGADGPYNEFAGRDATRLLAKHIVDPSEDDHQPLTTSEREEMQNWKDYFKHKYEHVGTLVKQDGTPLIH